MPAVVFPHLGFATSEGTILKWLVNVGDSVRKGDDLLEIVAEKAVAVVVAEEEGILQAIYAEPGAIVPEGETVGWIGTGGERAPAHSCRILGWEEEIAPAHPTWPNVLLPPQRKRPRCPRTGNPRDSRARHRCGPSAGWAKPRAPSSRDKSARSRVNG